MPSIDLVLRLEEHREIVAAMQAMARDVSAAMQGMARDVAAGTQAMAQGGRGGASGGGAAPSGAAYLQQRAQPQGQGGHTQQGPPGFMQRLGSFASSSRFSAGPLSPLVGRAMNLMGAGVAGGPVGIAVTAAVALGTALYKLADETAAVSRRFADLRAEAGGTRAETGALTAFGISGATSRAIHERITSDPMARMFASQMGVAGIGGPMGTMNTAKETLQILERLRRLHGEEQLRAARAVGAESLLPQTRMSEGQFGRMKGDADIIARIQGGKGFQTMGADYQAALSRMGNAKDNLLAALGKAGVIETMTDVFNQVADSINTLAGWVDRYGPEIKLAARSLKGALQVGHGNFIGAYKTLTGAAEGYGKDARERAGESQGAKVHSALDGNTSALDENTRALYALNGMIGGGERARSAIPSAYGQGGGANLHRALSMHALRLSQL